MWVLSLLLGCGINLEDEPVKAAYPETSIYKLDAPLEDQDAQSHSLDVYAGHPVLMSMVYTSCPMACPTLIRDIQSIESQLSKPARDDLRVLLVSLDPDRDSPEAMKTLAEGFSLDKARYKLARTTENPMRAIAAELDVRFSEVLDNGEMNHTSVLTLFDRNGTEVTQLHGLGRDSEAFVHRIEAIAGEQL